MAVRPCRRDQTNRANRRQRKIQEKDSRNANDFERKKAEQPKPRESEVPNTTFDDIAGLQDVKEAVMYKVIYPRKHPELYKTFKVFRRLKN